MKNIIFLAIFCCCFQFSWAQFECGIKAGFNTMDLTPSQLLVTNQESLDDFNLAVKEARFGAHFGIFLKIPINKLYLQPEILLNTNRVDFQVDSLKGFFSEKYQYLDIPVIAVWQLGPLKPQIGLVGHVFLNSSSDLSTPISAYKQDFKNLTIGWQAGVGFEAGKFLFDLRYEGNLSKFGSHITVSGNQYKFDQSPSRVVFSFGYKLLSD